MCCQLGDIPTIHYVIQAYRARAPQCLRWQYHVGDGLWCTYPNHIQRQIAAALAHGESRVFVDYKQQRLDLDLAAMCFTTPSGELQPVRSQLQSLIHVPRGSGWVVTSNLNEVAEWEGAFVVTGPAAATAAPNAATLAALTDEQVMDPCLWKPPAKNTEALGWVASPQSQQWMEERLLAQATAVTKVPAAMAGFVPHMDLGRRDRREAVGPGRGRPTESRFTDGLEFPRSDTGSNKGFYPPGYASSIGAIPFCMALPDNELGLLFDEGTLAHMCLDAVLKVAEAARQRSPYSPKHITPIYIYTYELPGDSAQIYTCMNRCGCREVCMWVIGGHCDDCMSISPVLLPSTQPPAVGCSTVMQPSTIACS